MSNAPTPQPTTTAGIQAAAQPGNAVVPPTIGNPNAPTTPAPDMSNLPGPTGTPEQAILEGNMQGAADQRQQAATEMAKPLPSAPHARLLQMIQGLSAAVAGGGAQWASRGKVNGAEVTNQILAQEAQQRENQQKLAMEQKQQDVQNHLAIGASNEATANMMANLMATKKDMEQKDVEMAQEKAATAQTTQQTAMSGQEFAEKNFGITIDQRFGKTPLTADDRARVVNGITNEISPKIAALPGMEKDPAVTSAQQILANPDSSLNDIFQARDTVNNAVGVKMASIGAQTAQAELEKTQAEAKAAPENVQLQQNLLRSQANKANADASLADATAKMYSMSGAGGGVTTPALQAQIAALPLDKQKVLAQYGPNVQADLLAVAFGHGDVDFDSVFPAQNRKGVPGINKQTALGALELLDPGFKEAAYKTKAKMYARATSGDLAKQADSLNNFIGHAAEAQSVSTTLHNTNARFLNSTLNEIQKQGYGTAVSNMQEAVSVVNGEFTVLVKGGYAPTEEETKAQSTLLNANATLGQIQGALQVMGRMANTRANTMNNDYSRGTQGETFPNLINPENVKAAQALGIDISKFNVGGSVGGNENATANGAQQPPTTPAPAGSPASKVHTSMSDFKQTTQTKEHGPLSTDDGITWYKSDGSIYVPGK